MKISKERTEEIVIMPLEVTNKEMKNLIEYFDKNCSQKRVNELKVEWSVNDILKKIVEENK